MQFTKDSDLPNVGSAINSQLNQLSSQLSPLDPSLDCDRFLSALFDVHDGIYGLIAQLSKLDLNLYKVNGIVVNWFITTHLLACRKIYDNGAKSQAIDAKLCEVLIQGCNLNIDLFLVLVEDGLYTKYFHCEALGNVFMELLVQSLELSINDLDFNGINNNELKLELMVKIVHSLYQETSVCNKMSPSWVSSILAVITKSLKALYLCNKSHLLLTVLNTNFPSSTTISSSLINPKLPFKFINYPILYENLAEYYIYCGFNLVQWSIDTQNHHLNTLATSFFTCYINLPSSSYPLIERRESTSPTEYTIKCTPELLLRQEVSLLYIINHLLSMDDMDQLTNPNKTYFLELDNLVRTLSMTLSKELTSDDIQSLPCSKSMGSILVGDYKEKLVAVLQFCESLFHPKLHSIINSYSLNKLSHYSHLVSVTKEEGKHVYFKAIEKVTKVIRLLALKYLSCGMSKISETCIYSTITDADCVDDILAVRPLLDYKMVTEGNNISYEFRCLMETPDLQTSITNQLKMIKLTDQLDCLLDKQT